MSVQRLCVRLDRDTVTFVGPCMPVLSTACSPAADYLKTRGVMGGREGCCMCVCCSALPGSLERFSWYSRRHAVVPIARSAQAGAIFGSQTRSRSEASPRRCARLAGAARCVTVQPPVSKMW